MSIYIKRTVRQKIDAEIDGVKNSRGKVIESRFEEEKK